MTEKNKVKSDILSNDMDVKNKGTCFTSKSFSLRNITQFVYLCQALSFFSWQIRKFWFGLLLGVAGWIFTIILIGFLILAIGLVWVIYRVVKGWLLLYDNKPIENSMALI